MKVDLDWSSYAGKKRQLPWFALAALALTDSGYRIFMHGARGHTTGRIYTEDLLSHLGMPVCSDWGSVQTCLDAGELAFMPLSSLSPTLNGIINMRNLLGLRSPVHTLCRLLNPLNAQASMQSIFHPAYGAIHHRAAQLLEMKSSLVFKGEGGECEYRPNADTQLRLLKNGESIGMNIPALNKGRMPIDNEMDVDRLISTWRHGTQSDYEQEAILGTIRIALTLMNGNTDREVLASKASDVWNNRKLQKL